MTSFRAISLDVGSTWTKGALFVLEAGEFRVLRRSETPTTAAAPVLGFRTVLSALRGPGFTDSASTPIYFSSSARGGLKIAALGLTPDLTLAVARLAACSAGGRVVRSYAYELTAGDVAEMERLDPDIVLFTGGTDGGNSRVVLANAARLAASGLRAVILYAGNRSVRDDVMGVLAGKSAAAVENVLPDVGTVNIEPAREVIRRLFLERIADGKGLTAAAREAGREPVPTPLAVFELVRAIGAAEGGWQDFAVIDLGGATTDFYSHTESFRGGDTILLRGLREPLLKRTVEGDLGLRVSAEALVESERGFVESRLAAAGREAAALEGYARSVAADTERLPDDPEGRANDRLLAAACVRASALRHAGVLTKVFTPEGGVFVQRGKDLRRVRRIVGTGGYLARCADAALLREACAPGSGEADARPLVPEALEAYADADYLFPLLANLAFAHPREAARTAVARLRRLERIP